MWEMDETMQEVLTHLKDVANTKIEVAQESRLPLHSLLLMLDKKVALNPNKGEEPELRADTSVGELGQS